MSIKQKITHNLLNIPGWHTNRHILVIESDDWGSIRMPSKKTYNDFLHRGIPVDKDPYCRFDTLATARDLEALFDVLTSVRDKNGRHAVITPNAVVANPIFDKIRESSYENYFYEPFPETLKRYGQSHDGAFEMWKQGIAENIFYPQFHGREHLNIKKWLRCLREDVGYTRTAFDFGTFGLTQDVDPFLCRNYMGAFNSALPEDLKYYDTLLHEGLDLFEQLFGYRSDSFIATTYTWHPDIEKSLKKYGVKFLQGMVVQKIPLDDDKTFITKKTNYTGRKSKNGLIYLTRNCFFEPSHRNVDYYVDDCLNRINISFLWHKPAIISTHRLNYIGVINENNRTQNLIGLKRILKEVVKKWPDVEFMSSNQLGSMIIDKLIKTQHDKI